MLKRLLFIFIFFSTLATQANEFEKLIGSYEKIFLYLYTPQCSYCVKFNPTYEKLAKNFSNHCKFIKIDANTEYGSILMHTTNSYYVPNVMLIDSRERLISRIEPTCLINQACVKDAVNKFIK